MFMHACMYLTVLRLAKRKQTFTLLSLVDTWFLVQSKPMLGLLQKKVISYKFLSQMTLCLYYFRMNALFVFSTKGTPSKLECL